MTEHHSLTFQGEDLVAVLDHETALDVIRTAGVNPPDIPEGCNTVSLEFFDAAGRACIYVCQRGMAPLASDDERQVNGALVVIGQRLPPTPESTRILRSFVETMLSPS